MMRLLAEVFQLFALIIFLNLLADYIAGREISLPNPLRFFTVAIVVSIVGGIGLFFFREKYEKQKER